MKHPNSQWLALTSAVCASAVPLQSCKSQAEAKLQKPYNIVYIMTDDHTAQMMSCYDTLTWTESPTMAYALPKALWPTPLVDQAAPASLQVSTAT